MKSKRPKRSIRRAHSTLDIACRGVFLGGILLSRRAIADSNEFFDPGISSVGLVYNPATNYVSQNLAAPTPTTISELVSGNELFSYNNPISCLTYQLQGSYFSANNGLTATAPNNNAIPITSAYASIGESDSFAFGMGPRIGTGTGISQSAPYGTYADPAQLTVNFNHMAFFVNASNGNPFPNAGIPDLLFQFGIGGQLQPGASASFGVQLTYFFYPTNTTNGFSFGGTPTALLTSPFTLNETWTNTGNTLMAFSNLTGDPQYPFSGVKYLTNAQLLKQPGVIDIVGNITFTASSPGGGGGGMMAQSQSGGGGNNNPSPAGFAIYLPQTSSVNYAQMPGRVFVETGGTDLSQPQAWMDITSGNGVPLAGPPHAQDIAQFDGENLSDVTNFYLNGSQTWGGVAVVNPGATVNITPGMAGDQLSIGSQGINVGTPQGGGGTQDLTISAPLTLSASQIWDAGPGRTVNIGAPTLNLGANGLTAEDSGNFLITASVIDSGAGGSIRMIGAGTMDLFGNNTAFHGNIILNSGEVAVAADANLGAAGSGITFSGGTLQILGTSLHDLDNHTVNWSGFDGGLDIADPNNYFNLDQPLGQNSINGGSLTKYGPGTLLLVSSNSYSGPTIINGGTLIVTSDGVLGSAGLITINTPAALVAGTPTVNGDVLPPPPTTVTLANPINVNIGSGEFLSVAPGTSFNLAGAVTTGTSGGDEYDLGFPSTTAQLYLTGPNTASANQAAEISEGKIIFLSGGFLSVNTGSAPLILGNASNPLNLTLRGNSRITNLSGGAVMEGPLSLSNSTVTLDDQSSLILGFGILDLNGNPSASAANVLNLNGGNLTAGGVFQSNQNTTSAIDFNGGVLTAASSNTDFISSAANATASLIQLNVGSGGVIINTNGFNETLNNLQGFNSLSGSTGGLAKNGVGNLILGSGFNSSPVAGNPISGPVIVNGGLLEVSSVSQIGNSTFQMNAGGAFGDDEVTNAGGLASFIQRFHVAPGLSGAIALTPFFAGASFDYSNSGQGVDFSGNLSNLSLGAISGTPVAMTGAIIPGTNSQTGVTTYQLGGGGTLQMVLVNGQSPLMDSSVGTANVLIENGGAVLLSTTNTYSGTTTIQGSNVLTIPAADSPTGADQHQLEVTTLQVTNLSDNASSIGNSGAGTASNLVINGGVLQYVGAGETSSRLFTIGQFGATIDASGSGPLNLQNIGAESFAGGIAGGQTLTLAGTNTGSNVLAALLADPAAGTLQLVKTGPGIWDVTNANTFTGGTILDGGTLQITSDANIGGPSSAITFNGGELQLLSTTISSLSSHAVNWSTFNGGLNIPVGGILTIGANVGGTGSLTKDGTGILVLSGTNTYSGGTIIDAGTLRVSDPSQLGTGAVVDNGVLQFTETGAATIAFGISGTGSVLFSGAATIAFSGSNSYGGTTTVSSGTCLILDYSAAANAAAPILGGSVNLAGGVLEIKPGNSLGVVQKFNGTTISSGPNLLLDTASAPGMVDVNLGVVTRAPNSSGATLQISAPISGTVSAIQISANTPTASLLAAVNVGQRTGYATFGTDWAALTPTAGGSSYIVPGSLLSGFYTPLSGGTSYSVTSNLDVVGTNQQILLSTAALGSLRFNTPSGGFVNVNGNSIDQVDIGSVINTGAFLVTPNVGANNVLITPNSSGSNQNTQAIVLSNSDAVFWQFNTLGMLILNTGVAGRAMTKQGPGVMAVNATSTYTQNTFIEGGILQVPYDAALGGTTLTAVNFFGGTLMASQSFASTRAMVANPQGAGFVAAHLQQLTINGAISGSGPISVGSAATIGTAVLASGNSLSIGSAIGDGLVVFGTNNFMTGPVSVNAGRLELLQSGSLGSTSALAVNAGGTLLLTGNNISIPSLSGAGVIQNQSPSPASINVTGSSSTLFSGILQFGVSPTNLIISGSGTLALSGSNNASGFTTLNSGELSVASTGSLSPVINFNGGVLQVTGTSLQNLNNQTVNWTGFNGGFDIADPNNTLSISQNISGTGSLLKLGAGTLSLTGTNTYTGNTDIEGGTVVINSVNALGAGTLINNGQVVFNNPGTITLTGNLTGSGNLIISGIGVLLTGSNTYTGSTTVNPGSFFSLSGNNTIPANTQMLNNGSLNITGTESFASVSGTGTTTVANTGSLSLSGFTQNALVNNGAAIIGCGGNVGSITGNGALTIGTNNMIGELQLTTNHGSDAVKSLTIVSGSTLDITNHTVTISFGSPANDPVATILGYLKSGYNNAHWTGTGIVSSIAAAGTNPALSVGYADGNTDIGTAAGPNQAVVKYTLSGDANLDTLVNFNDLVAVVQNFNKSGTDWAHGNFHYALTTSFNDLVTVVQNFNKTLPFNASVGGPTTVIPLVSATDTQLPEPGAIALSAAGAAGLLARRRRKDGPRSAHSIQ